MATVTSSGAFSGCLSKQRRQKQPSGSQPSACVIYRWRGKKEYFESVSHHYLLRMNPATTNLDLCLDLDGARANHVTEQPEGIKL